MFFGSRSSPLRLRANVLAGTAIVAASIMGFTAGAHANLLILAKPTRNVTCANGACKATSRSAVLNVTQLQSLLASSDVTVEASTAGFDSTVVETAVTWVSAHTLTLQGYSVVIDQPVSVEGSGGLTFATQEITTAGGISFGPKGHVTFWSTSSNLTIAGKPYVLVNSIASLASAVAANPSGHYALANSYDASTDGTYRSAPVAGASLEGLGNSISNLSIDDPVAGDEVGLFGETSNTSDLRLNKIDVRGADDSQVGGLAGIVLGTLLHDSVDGTISTHRNTGAGGLGAVAGGLAGVSYGIIENSYSTGKVAGGKNSIIGGAVGEISRQGQGSGISQVYSTAMVALDSGECRGCSTGAPQNSAGGLVGANDGRVLNSYATGTVTGGSSANLGGLVGTNVKGPDSYNQVMLSYSSGAVTGGPGSSIGGSLGFDLSPGDSTDMYWDTTTSGISNSSQGAGNVANDSGIEGLTTTQLQSGLPAGFNSQIWAESANVNGGLPYLLDVPVK